MNCEKCGTALPEGAAVCEFCGQPVEQPAPAMQEQAPTPVKKPENIATGIVGALIGAAIGAAVIILLSRLGYVASISGFILAVCTLKGYELLGRQLSIKSIIICIVLILLTPYLADRLDWALIIKDSYADLGVTFAEAFAAVPTFIEEGYIEKASYLKNLLMIYGFAALGAFGTLRDVFKKK